MVSSWQKGVPQTSSSRICPKMSWAIPRGPHLPVRAHTSFYLDSDGWLCIEIGRPFCSNCPQLGAPFKGLKLCLGCHLRMLLAASDRNSQHENIPKTILLGSLFSDPLSSAFLGTCCQCKSPTGPKKAAAVPGITCRYTTSSREELFLPARDDIPNIQQPVQQDMDQWEETLGVLARACWRPGWFPGLHS